MLANNVKSRCVAVLFTALYGLGVARLSYFVIFEKLLISGNVTDALFWFMIPGSLLLWPLYPGGYHSGTGWFVGMVVSNTIAYILILFFVVRAIKRVRARRKDL
jgi:hypothetical protein